MKKKFVDIFKENNYFVRLSQEQHSCKYRYIFKQLFCKDKKKAPFFKGALNKINESPYHKAFNHDSVIYDYK